VPQELSSILDDKSLHYWSDDWMEKAINKLYALFVSFGFFVVIIGLWAAYIEGLDDLVYFLIAVYITGSVVFVTKWNSNSTSFRFLIFYLYLTGNGLMFYCTDEVFGIFWLFIVPILVAIFKGRFQGLLFLGVSVLFTIIWGTMASLGYLKWDIGTTGMPLVSWVVVIQIFVLTALSIIYAIGTVIDSYSDKIKEKDEEHSLLIAEKKKLAQSKMMLQQEIDNTIRLEKEKKVVESRFETLFDAAQDMYVIHLKNGKISDVNAETISRLGYSKSELTEPESRSALLSNIKLNDKQLNELKTSGRSIVEGNVYDYEGKPTPVEFNNKIISLGEDEVILSIIRDISHRRESEKEIERVNKDLQVKVLERTAQFDDAMQELRSEIKQRLNTEHELRRTKEILENNLQEEKKLSEMKTRFVSMISHEYRTPLTIIYTCTDILEFVFQKQDQALFDKNINKIKRSVNAMINLLEDVLIVGRSEVKSVGTTMSEFDLIKIANEAKEELSIIDNHEHKINIVNLDSHCEVKSDKKLVQYIIRNLVTNAQKYSPSGSPIDIGIECDSKLAHVSIKDRGIGIPKEEISELFKPFYRSSNVDARSGTGLGLAICKQYADAIGGELKVESVEGEGSTFTLTFSKILSC
jgi:PAS domain S-box-containing protein